MCVCACVLCFDPALAHRQLMTTGGKENGTKMTTTTKHTDVAECGFV